MCGRARGVRCVVGCVCSCLWCVWVPFRCGRFFLGTLGARRRGVPGSWSGSVVGRVYRVLVSVGVVVGRWVWACRGPCLYHRFRYGQVRARLTLRQQEKIDPLSSNEIPRGRHGPSRRTRATINPSATARAFLLSDMLTHSRPVPGWCGDKLEVNT